MFDGVHKKYEKIVLTIILSGFVYVINYLITFFLTPYITDNIGTEAYGYVSLAKTIVTYILIVTSVLNSYASRYIAVAYHKKEIDKCNTYFNTVFFGNIIFGGLLCVVCLLFCENLEGFLNISTNIAKDVKTLFFLVFANLFLNLVGTAWQAASIVKNQLIYISLFKGIAYVAEAISLILMYLFLSMHLYYVGIGMLVSTVIVLSTHIFITVRWTSEIKIGVRYFEFDVIKELVVTGIWNSLNSLGNMLNSGLDLLITNMFLGGLALGQVSIVKNINSIFQGLYQIVGQPFQPVLLKLYTSGEKSELINNLKFSMKISGFVSNLAFAGVVAYGRYYYKLWIPNQDCELLYYLTVIACASSVFEGAIYPLYYIYTLTMKNKFPCIVTIIGGICNVTGMVMLINKTNLGVYAVFVTTAIVMLVINGITNPIYMSKCLDIVWSSFYVVLVKHICSCFVISVLFVIIANLCNLSNWGALILVIILSCMIGIIIHSMIMFRPKEIYFIIKKIIKNED